MRNLCKSLRKWNTHCQLYEWELLPCEFWVIFLTACQHESFPRLNPPSSDTETLTRCWSYHIHTLCLKSSLFLSPRHPVAMEPPLVSFPVWAFKRKRPLPAQASVTLYILKWVTVCVCVHVSPFRVSWLYGTLRRCSPACCVCLLEERIKQFWTIISQAQTQVWIKHMQTHSLSVCVCMTVCVCVWLYDPVAKVPLCVTFCGYSINHHQLQ